MRIYLPFKSLYGFIVQRNHVDYERYKPAKKYNDAIRTLNSHFVEMQSTYDKIENELKSDNLKNYFEVKCKYNFRFINKIESDQLIFNSSDIEKEKKHFQEIVKKFNEIKGYFKNYEKHISIRISYDARN
jgi:xylose isomerase